MSLLQQLIDYLSQPPDSTVYHIVTLLALQATLGLAWWQIKRRPEDDFARRLAWASGAILLAKLLVLLILFATSGLVEAVALLPPLERAVDALAVAILVWALAPRSASLPRFGSALLLIILIVISILYVAFAAEWREFAAGGTPEFGYADTQQAVIWSILQVSFLVVGALLVIYARESQWSLRLSILILLLIAQALSLMLGSSYNPPNVEVSAWTRLGNLIAFPVLAVLTYRHNLQVLLPTSHMGAPAVERLVQSLALSGNVSSSLQPTQTLEASLDMVFGLLPVRFAAVARTSEDRPQQLNVIARTNGTNDQPGRTHESVGVTRSWRMKPDERSVLFQVLRDGQAVELLSDGHGARQYHELQQELKLDQKGALLIQPLFAEDRKIGLLILARGPSLLLWSENEKNLVRTLGVLVGDALHNAQRHQLALAGQAPDFERQIGSPGNDLDRIARQRDQALRQVDQLNEEVAQLSDQLSIAQERLGVDDCKLRETTQALALAVQRQKKAHQLEEELAGLREALSEAELALANAAAGEAGLSTEWVMRTVTRYSGELEEAQAQINALEERLKKPDGQELLQRANFITGRLRTPLTALGGYTDLMLDRATGELTAQQESLLRRMRVNVDDMATIVDSLSNTSRSTVPEQSRDALISVQEALEEALYAVSRELQSKKLRVDVYIEDGLPSLEDSANSLNELLAKLLGAVCLASDPDGRLYISAKRLYGENQGASDPIRFLKVSISDDGGARSHGLYARTIFEPGSSTGDRSPAHIEELARLLDTASLMASSRGGRSWLDLSHPKGSKVILLLPFPAMVPDASR